MTRAASAGVSPSSNARQRSRFPGKKSVELAAAYRDAQRFLRREYVTGVGIGYAMKRGRYTKQIAISIHVSAKLEESRITKAQRFPKSLRGVRVDVVQLNINPQLSDSDFQARQRTKADPLRPGILIKTDSGDFGTLGLVVTKLSDGQTYILGSGHVLGAPGTKVFQPNRTVAPNSIGDVTIVNGTPGDAAIARCSGRGFRNQPQGTNVRINSVRRAAIGEVFQLSGAMTGLTNGEVVWVGIKDIVYGPNDRRRVNGFQLKPATNADPITERGDSGALWFDSAGAGVGLHVGSDTDPNEGNSWFFACHLEEAMAEMELSL